MKSALPDNRDARRVILQIKRALCGYITFMGACRAEKAFSEHILYEPILRVLIAHGYEVECEHTHPSISKAAKGSKRIDLFATGHEHSMAIEVKWTKKSPTILVEGDAEKLALIAKSSPNCLPLLCVFGRKRHIDKSRLKLKPSTFVEWGKPVYVDRRPMYGCRVFRFVPK